MRLIIVFVAFLLVLFGAPYQEIVTFAEEEEEEEEEEENGGLGGGVQRELLGNIIRDVQGNNRPIHFPLVDTRIRKEIQERAANLLIENAEWSIRHNRSVYEWHRFSTEAIFWIVVGLVICGILLAAFQFHRSLRRGDSVGADLEISGKGIRISSPVLGTIILLLSFFFFYLYLVHVYPITNRVTEGAVLEERNLVPN